jgi:hypothetical protein
MVSSANLTPLSPLQPESFVSDHRHLWLERGVQVREGTQPPLKFFPPLEQILMRVYGINPFERGTQGVSINE